jgi:L-cysteine desulfidase
MNVQRNIEVRSSANVAVEKQQVSHILCVCVCVCVALGIHATYCHLWPVRFQTFLHIISQMARFSKEKEGY